MSVFVFKLESVLDQRRNVERERQRDFAQAQRRIMQLERELQKVNDLLHSRESLGRGIIRSRVLLAQARYQSSLRHKLASLRSQIPPARAALAIAQSVLVEAAKQRKIMEKLRENQQRRFEAEKQKREIREQDEAARLLGRAENEVESAAGS